MLIPILHRKRKAAEMAAKAIGQAGGAVEETRRVYSTRLLVRGLLWLSVYLLSRGLLELPVHSHALRIVIALAPTPFFIWYLVTWMRGAAAMDELQRQIELEALGFAFPSALVFLSTLGLLDVAITLNPDDFSLRHTWLMLPMLYYIGLWRAQRKYL
jgi:hypothetical protein